MVAQCCYSLSIQQSFFTQRTDFLESKWILIPGHYDLSVTSCIVSEWDANCSSLSVQQILRACHKFCQQCYQLVEWKKSWGTLLSNCQCLGIFLCSLDVETTTSRVQPQENILHCCNIKVCKFHRHGSLRISNSSLEENCVEKFWENRGKNFAKIEQKLLWK